MKVSSIIYDVSRDLNDQVPSAEYIRWTEEQLHSYYAEVVLDLASTTKWLFTHTIVQKLVPTDGWQPACDKCTEVLRVLGESTADGEQLSYVQERLDDNVFIWPGATTPRCIVNALEDTSYIDGYAINKLDEKFFKVYPPVKPGQPARYALIECYQEPDTDDLNFDVPDRLVQAIKQWMLYRALIVDSENNPAIVEVAKTHLSEYENIYKKLYTEAKEREAKIDAKLRRFRAIQNPASK